MRKVMFRQNERSGYNLKGIFHTWGLSDGESGSYTIGIIEDEEGIINAVRPWDIKFINE